jgi:hypothetical protein
MEKEKCLDILGWAASTATKHLQDIKKGPKTSIFLGDLKT